VEDFSATLRLDPSYHLALNNRGTARLRLGEEQAARGRDPFGELKQAERDLRAALRSGRTEARWNLGLVYRQMGRYRDSLEAFAAVAGASPEEAKKAQPEIDVMGPLTRFETRPWAADLSAAQASFESGDWTQARWRFRRATGILEDVFREADADERMRRLVAARLREAFAAAHYAQACLEAAASAGRAAPGEPAQPPSEEVQRESRDRAIRHLEEALRFGYDDSLEPMDSDEHLAPLCSDPRFIELVKRER